MAFFISKTYGFLGARPDGIITDQEESTPGVVEFKYIQVKPGLKLLYLKNLNLFLTNSLFMNLLIQGFNLD